MVKMRLIASRYGGLYQLRRNSFSVEIKQFPIPLQWYYMMQREKHNHYISLSCSLEGD